jgi:hypothetical protein
VFEGDLREIVHQVFNFAQYWLQQVTVATVSAVDLANNELAVSLDLQLSDVELFCSSQPQNQRSVFGLVVRYPPKIYGLFLESATVPVGASQGVTGATVSGVA